MQALGLLATWVLGVMLVGSSVYLSNLTKYHKSGEILGSNSRGSNIVVTVLSAYRGALEEQHVVALSSWLHLKPSPCLVLLGQDPSLLDFANGLKPRARCISVQSDIEFTYLGAPFLHSMIQRARAFAADVSVVIDPDVVLLQDFMDVLQQVSQLDHDWLLFSGALKASNLSLSINTHEMQKYVGNEEKCTGVKVWAWNTGKVPLHAGVLPSFIYGAGYHNEWLLNEASVSKLRQVIDATEAVSAYSLDFTVARPWEAEGNAYLAATYGSYYLDGIISKAAVNILLPCGPRICLCNHGGGDCTFLSVSGRPAGSKNTGKRKRKCKQVEPSPVVLPARAKPGFSSYTFELESLLEQVASRPGKVVVLTVVGHSYRDMLMSWHCRLKLLNISNYIVSAIDEDMYRFGILQGLPVFRADRLVSSSDFEDCTFGTECFKKVTKIKSRTVLRILQLGYHVMFSDVDVYWFTNPIPELMLFGPGTLVAQSDSYNETESPNVPRRLNSGFYFVWSDASSIDVFRRIVSHAQKSKLSEQPSFYDVLCGPGGRYRVGSTKCVEPETNLTVHFLDRLRFPNGGYRSIWDSPDARSTCKAYGCIVLHNNWKTGALAKKERQQRSGLWDYNEESRTCRRAWESANSLHWY